MFFLVCFFFLSAISCRVIKIQGSSWIFLVHSCLKKRSQEVRFVFRSVCVSGDIALDLDGPTNHPYDLMSLSLIHFLLVLFQLQSASSTLYVQMLRDLQMPKIP